MRIGFLPKGLPLGKVGRALILLYVCNVPLELVRGTTDLPVLQTPPLKLGGAIVGAF